MMHIVDEDKLRTAVEELKNTYNDSIIDSIVSMIVVCVLLCLCAGSLHIKSHAGQICVSLVSQNYIYNMQGDRFLRGKGG